MGPAPRIAPGLRRVLLVVLLLFTLLLFSSPASDVVAKESQVPATGFVLPVAAPSVLLTPFRAPHTPYGPGHRGADLAAPVGSPVRAAGPGSVVFAGSLAGRGVVSIEHEGGLRTTYEPVSSSVPKGRVVAAGEIVGTVQAGHQGCAPATCLHWGARLTGRLYLDPMSLLGPWPVRLLPWAGR